ncbi:MAG: DMT family transporter [Muribaculaceae bacterium]|nr:DMT family transporter [Muribaculaceae bacterium]
MQYFGELISIGVAFSWTATALLSEFGSKRMGNLTLNVARMGITLVFSCILFWAVTGSPLPAGASREAYLWMMLSGLVGYVIGDFCLFQCYIIIGSKFGQLFMTLAPITAAIMAWITLGEHISSMGIVAMLVTLTGIAISVLGRGGDGHHKLVLNLPLNGVLFAVGAAVCQGVGLVLSKIGMNHYAASIATPCEPWMLPFFANFFRCIAGIVGFSILLHFREGFSSLRKNITDAKSMTAAVLTTIFGPFVGVGCSLLAVQYTSAGIASTLMALTPIIIILPAWWLFKQPITTRSVVGALISVLGVSLFFLL